MHVVRHDDVTVQFESLLIYIEPKYGKKLLSACTTPEYGDMVAYRKGDEMNLTAGFDSYSLGHTYMAAGLKTRRSPIKLIISFFF